MKHPILFALAAGAVSLGFTMPQRGAYNDREVIEVTFDRAQS